MRPQRRSLPFVCCNSEGGSVGRGLCHENAVAARRFQQAAALQGVLNIEATQSGIFCTAMIVDGADAGEGITLPLVRINPHPGTLEQRNREDRCRTKVENAVLIPDPRPLNPAIGLSFAEDCPCA